MIFHKERHKVRILRLEQDVLHDSQISQVLWGSWRFSSRRTSPFGTHHLTFLLDRTQRDGWTQQGNHFDALVYTHLISRPRRPVHLHRAKNPHWQQHTTPSHYVMLGWKCTKWPVRKWQKPQLSSLTVSATTLRSAGFYTSNTPKKHPFIKHKWKAATALRTPEFLQPDREGWITTRVTYWCAWIAHFTLTKVFISDPVYAGMKEFYNAAAGFRVHKAAHLHGYTLMAYGCLRMQPLGDKRCLGKAVWGDDLIARFSPGCQQLQGVCPLAAETDLR